MGESRIQRVSKKKIRKIRNSEVLKGLISKLGRQIIKNISNQPFLTTQLKPKESQTITYNEQYTK